MLRGSYSRQCDALSYESRWGGRTGGKVACGIVSAHSLRRGISIASYRDLVGYLQTPRELMRGAVRDHLYPLALDSLTIRNPDTLAVTVTAMRIPGIRIRLLHRTVSIEDIHMIGKRRIGIPNKPRPHNRVRNAASGRRSRASEQACRSSGYETGQKKSALRNHVNRFLKVLRIGARSYRETDRRDSRKLPLATGAFGSQTRFRRRTANAIDLQIHRGVLNGLRTSMPGKCFSLSVTTTQSFTSATAATIISRSTAQSRGVRHGNHQFSYFYSRTME
jgi:hypothetical protein